MYVRMYSTTYVCVCMFIILHRLHMDIVVAVGSVGSVVSVGSV